MVDDGTLWGDGVCTLCGGTEFLDFFESTGIPAQDGVLWPTYDEAMRAPKGDISLGLCLGCGFIGNRLFQPDLLRFVGYNVSLEHSPLYQDFIGKLASRLIERYDLRGKTVLELGCGNGYFLRAISAAGGNHGVGFDPSYVGPDAVDNVGRGVRFIRDYYSERHAEHQGDLVCCRQVIDHLGSPKTFLKMVRRAMGDRPDAVAYFEVPNPERRFQQLVPWNIGYEHGSWFYPDAFRALFELSGFEVRDVAVCHSGEYLGIEASPASVVDRTGEGPRRAAVRRLAEELKARSHEGRAAVLAWKERLEGMKERKLRVIPWGAGEHGIGFLSSVKCPDLIPYIVDINPGRIGKYLPGTGQRVVPPEFLVEYRPDVIIVSKAAYLAEIRQQAASLGVKAEFLAL